MKDQQLILSPATVRALNRAGRFSFCGLRCKRARIKHGRFEVSTADTCRYGDHWHWMGAKSWIKMSYTPEDHDDALAGAFTVNENRFKPWVK